MLRCWVLRLGVDFLTQRSMPMYTLAASRLGSHWDVGWVRKNTRVSTTARQ